MLLLGLFRVVSWVMLSHCWECSWWFLGCYYAVARTIQGGFLGDAKPLLGVFMVVSRVLLCCC